MAKATATTIARRSARKALIAHFAGKGIRLTEREARVEMRNRAGKFVSEAVSGYTATVLIRKAEAAAAPAYLQHLSEPKGDSAWIATDGRFFSVSFAGHSAFAGKCAEAGIVNSQKYGSYVPALEDKGWIHISGHSIVNSPKTTARLPV